VIVIDAGVNAEGMKDSGGKALAEARLAEIVLTRLLDFIGPDGYVRELLLSHAHSDHVNLVPALLRKVAVGMIRFNDVMRRWAGTLRQQMQ
jgi:glyoxylase-like metal-dependent hydrolase (beta-lactamase superfamily II)